MPETIITKSVEEIYSQKEILDFYTKLVGFGLYENEKKLLPHICQSKDILVIGCGAGREVFALSSSINTVVGIDTSKAMISRAQKFKQPSQININFYANSLADFSSNEKFDNQKFDTLWITFGLTGHILKSTERVDFFKKCSQLVKSNGNLVYLAEIEKRKSITQKGRSHFGGTFHFSTKYPYHYFTHLEEALDETKKAGFQVCWKQEDGAVLTLC